MELDQHFYLHCLFIILVTMLNYVWLHFVDDWTYFLTLITSFIINPDLDKLLDKVKEKLTDIKEKITRKDESSGLFHRSIFTHSALLPIILYYSLRRYLVPIFGTPLVFQFTLWCFFPVIVHLIGDLKPAQALSAIMGDTKEYIEKSIEIEKKKKNLGKKSTRKFKIDVHEGDQRFGGTWQYSFMPITRKRGGFYGTLIGMSANILFMVGFIIYLFYFP